VDFSYRQEAQQFHKVLRSWLAAHLTDDDTYETGKPAASGVMHALWAADNADDGERQLAALRVKAFSGRLATVGDQAIQVFGGIRFTWEHDAHLYLSDC
jgi:hypothetical protein